ncbi:MAG: hypothetical protein JSS16_12925 [Proteobacteria bacterium]|uniref:hypothetical protein n=1 Tax=Rudaea sp. TaxID=2136325 RepID=UPI001D71632C|nr:hypothetical protein [Pseudomonadota bacterium]MBS0566850.1 hypothetical protein [Pseudomonadota bacterium]
MNLFDPIYLVLGIALGLPMAILALLNWLLRKRGGFARGWAGAIFLGLCLCVGIVLIVVKAMS